MLCRNAADRPRIWPARSLVAMGLMCAWGSAPGQQAIGSVAVRDATVSGALEVSGGRAVLVGTSVVVARDQAAEIALGRGGTVLVCQTSGLHLAQGGAAKGTAVAVTPLLLALDRGAMEVRMEAVASDVVMTPDMRFAMRSAGPLDLRLRVTANGDTCVENRGAKAPVLSILAQFGDGSYELQPRQHVLFEHGNLREVVDHEASSCGCPPAPTVSVAEAMMAPSGGATTADAAARAHPFPAAVSEGLAPAAGVPQAQTGAANAQVATTLSYGAEAVPAASGPASAKPADAKPTNASGATAPEKSAAVSETTSRPRNAAGAPRDVAHVVGRFFKRLFGRG